LLSLTEYWETLILCGCYQPVAAMTNVRAHVGKRPPGLKEN
jgi:hypothetical protein